MIHNVKYFGRQLLKQLQPTQPPTVSRTKMSTGQSAVILCSWQVKGGWLIQYLDKRVGWQVKLCDPINTCHTVHSAYFTQWCLAASASHKQHSLQWHFPAPRRPLPHSSVESSAWHGKTPSTRWLQVASPVAAADLPPVCCDTAASAAVWTEPDRRHDSTHPEIPAHTVLSPVSVRPQTNLLWKLLRVWPGPQQNL